MRTSNSPKTAAIAECPNVKCALPKELFVTITMKYKIGRCGIALALFFILATPLFGQTPWRIEVVGDSISVGFEDNPNWTVPYQFGWRSGLYSLLTNSSVAFQFVGNSPQPWNGISGLPTNTPVLDLRLLGQDHCQGYGGVNTAFIETSIGAWLAADQPNIVLLMIGINDLGEGSTGEPTGTEANLFGIVSTIVNNSPGTHVIVAQITPYSGYTDSLVRYNNYIANTLVPHFAGLGALVTTVNQYTNLCFPGTTNINAALYANGINHPVPEAYNLMAKTWFQGIQALNLPAFPPSLPAHYNLVANGDFELPLLPGNSHNVNPAAGFGWSYTGSGGAGSGIDVGLAYGQGGTLAYSGAQRACLQSSGTSAKTQISQVISNFVPGQYYQVAFASEAINAFSGANPFQVAIIDGTTTNFLFGGAFITPAASGYTVYTSAPFLAGNPVLTLDFLDSGAKSSVAYVSWIDAVSICAASHANLVVNGGFEAPPTGANTHNVNPPPAGYSWVYTSGASGAGSGIDHGDPYGTTFNDGSYALDYLQQGCLQGSGNGTVTHISQIISNFVAGQYYQLSFAAKGIGAFSGADPFRVAIINGTTTNLLFGGGDLAPTAGGYTFYTSAPFLAGNPVMKLDFFDNPAPNNTYVSWLDDVGIYAVPPPTPPTLGVPLVSSGNLILMGTNGTPNLGYSLLQTTSLTPPVSWSTNRTGILDGTGSFSNSIPITPATPESFFELRTP